MIEYAYSVFDVSSEADSDRRVLAFDMTENQFDDFHLAARRLPEETQPEFRIEAQDVIVLFEQRISLRFHNAAVHLPARQAFMLMGRVNYPSHAEVVIAITIVPA